MTVFQGLGSYMEEDTDFKSQKEWMTPSKQSSRHNRTDAYELTGTVACTRPAQVEVTQSLRAEAGSGPEFPSLTRKLLQLASTCK